MPRTMKSLPTQYSPPTDKKNLPVYILDVSLEKHQPNPTEELVWGAVRKRAVLLLPRS